MVLSQMDASGSHCTPGERDFFIDDQPVQIHFIIEMIDRFVFTPSVFEYPVSGRIYLSSAHQDQSFMGGEISTIGL